jgi:LmbE family N-acetylglucosaminyl deacetylase
MGSLPQGSPVLAVCAHPDDESFGLGAALAAFAGRGTPTAVLCLTHGTASSLGTSRGDLHQIRAAELAAAAAELGVGDVELLDYPDGALTQQPAELLSGHVEQAARRAKASLLLVFDEGGITGHPDHQQATRAARLYARRAGLPVLAWAVEQRVAASLNAEFGTSFAGRPAGQIDCCIEADRRQQLSAIACHASQAHDNPVLWRRLELQGNREVFRWLDRAGETVPAGPGPAGTGEQMRRNEAAYVLPTPGARRLTGLHASAGAAVQPARA